MGLITVYRVEDEHGIGPYHSLFKTQELEEMIHEHDELPAWVEDMKVSDYLKINSQYVSGFETLEQYDEWFRGKKSVLNRHGFKLNEYYVEEGNLIRTKSGKQIIFYRDSPDLAYLMNG